MKNTQIPQDILGFSSLKDPMCAKIPKGFDTTHVLNLYHLIESGITSISHTDPLHAWLEEITQKEQNNILIFLLQTQKLVEERIQDTLG